MPIALGVISVDAIGVDLDGDLAVSQAIAHGLDRARQGAEPTANFGEHVPHSKRGPGMTGVDRPNSRCSRVCTHCRIRRAHPSAPAPCGNVQPALPTHRVPNCATTLVVEDIVSHGTYLCQVTYDS